MPELPEAETIALELARGLTGQKLGEVRHVRRDMIHGDPRPLKKLLPGRTIERVYRRAKRVILVLSGQVQLVFRLGMTGRMMLTSAKSPVEPHTHLRLAIRGRPERELRFQDARRFGGIWCITGKGRHVGPRLGPLGDEPLEVTPARFGQLLSRKRQIKALLMDQAVIAGLGNIYTDESLFAAGIHPLVRSDELDGKRAGQLLRSIKTILRSAIRHHGSTLMDYRQANGEPGSFQNLHRVYQRQGKPCKRCDTPIERIIAAGRSTFFCPNCQPENM